MYSHPCPSQCSNRQLWDRAVSTGTHQLSQHGVGAERREQESTKALLGWTKGHPSPMLPIQHLSPALNTLYLKKKKEKKKKRKEKGKETNETKEEKSKRTRREK